MSVHVLCGLLLSAAAAAADVKNRKIPGGLILFGWALGAGLWLGKWGGKGIFTWLTGACALLGVGFLLYRLHAFGAGDVKLLSVLGGVLGLRRGLSVFVLSLLLTVAYGMICAAGKGELKRFACRCLACLEGLFRRKDSQGMYGEMLHVCYGAVLFVSMLFWTGGVWLWNR